MKRFYLLGLSIVPAVGLSQAVINDGTSSFGWSTAAALSGAANRTGAGGGASNVFIRNGSVDQSFQEWWWYRANGINTREFALSNQANAPVVSGNQMTLTYREPEGFTSTLRYTINNIGNATLVTGTNFVRNEGNNPLSLEFYNYIDWDMNGTSGGDNASLLAPNPAIRIRVTGEAGSLEGEYRALDAIAYEAGLFPGVRNLLTDADADNFNNTGLPLVNEDIAYGVQWRFTLDPGHEIALQTTRVLTTVPEPATLCALGIGALALIRRRRK